LPAGVRIGLTVFTDTVRGEHHHCSAEYGDPLLLFYRAAREGSEARSGLIYRVP
jgi:hypothetical protein